MTMFIRETVVLRSCGMTRVLEINVDDLNFGGVFSLVKNVISNKKDDIKLGR